MPKTTATPSNGAEPTNGQGHNMNNNTKQEKKPSQAPRPVTDETRSEVRRLHGLGFGRNQIARELSIGAATVSNIAKAEDPPLEFDRTATALAVEAHRIDLAASRAQLSAMLLVRAREALEAMDAPAVVFSFGGKDNTYSERLLDAPPVGDQRNQMTIAAIALQRHADLERIDSDGGNLPGALGMVGEMHESLGAIYRSLAAAGEMPDPTETPDRMPAEPTEPTATP